MLVGAVAGGALATREPVQHATRVAIVLAPSPVSLAPPEPGADPRDQQTVTIDTEAALAVSRESLSRVTGSSAAADLEELRERIRVSAVPSTRVLTLEVRDTDAERSEDQAVELADSYLLTRSGYLSDRREQALTTLRDQLAELEAPTASTPAPTVATRQRLEAAVSEIVLTPTSAGEVIRVRGPVVLRQQIEVPVTSGAALGLAVGAGLLATFPGWRPLRRRRRGRR
jgi:hypothetical protein